MKINSLTNTYTGISNSIVTPAILKNPFTGQILDTQGLWDTGATDSVITKSSAAKLGLIPTSKATVNGVHGQKDVNVYYVNITLNNNNITLNTKVTECEELSSDHSVGMIIGMNIICQGDFAITNMGGQTVMSFRTPSLQVIDFVKGIKSSTPIVSSKIPGRNDPCACGSNKKYKHCCGKK